MDNDFNTSDLEALRDDITKMSDEELSSKLDELSFSEDFSDEEVVEIQRRLNCEIKGNRRRTVFHRIVAAAAAVLAFALLISAVFMYNMQQKYHEYEDLLSHEVSIGTQQGENISTVLPDGSKIIMSPESSLAYKLATFNHMQRIVLFSGEAKFSITKNEKAPFFVNSNDFEIKVLGTIFSVLSRDNKDNVEIHLDEGSIELIATKSNTRKILKTGETAVINKVSGNLTIYGEGDNYRYSAAQSVLFFTSEELKDVLEELKLYYGKEFALRDNIGDRTFTGSLPTDDLDQALYVLQQTLNLEVSNVGDTYLIQKSK